MAKYRKASEKTIARGKGISTDKLSLKEAKDYFNERAKETGAKRFRHNGQVYDLAGNKITESAPARSSGGGSSAVPGSSRPKARPATSAGGAKADQRTSGAPPARPARTGAPAKRGEVNPVAVGVGAAGAVAAGVAAVRSGRSGPATGTPRTSTSDRVRAAGAKARGAVMGVPAKPAAASSTGGPARTPVAKPAAKSSTGGPARTKVAKPTTPAAAPAKAKPAAKPRGGARAVGNNPGSMIGRTGAGPLAELPEILKLKDM